MRFTISSVASSGQRGRSAALCPFSPRFWPTIGLARGAIQLEWYARRAADLPAIGFSGEVIHACREGRSLSSDSIEPFRG